nr:PREDICTED: F-box/LRR-repeat protein 20 isoform X1 [Rhinolophus sinicus]
MRSGVAGRWGVFLFWVEVEAEEREELATSNRRCRPRRGRWRRPSRNREVSPPPPTAAARRFPASSRSRNSRACPGPLVFALRSPAAPGPGRTRRPHEEGRKRSDQEQMFSNSDEAVINKKLPKELLLRIFSFLDVVTLCRCAQVSRAWNVLALDGSNWQRIDLFDFQRDIEGRVVENISKRCGGFLRKLSLRGCLGVGDNALRTFAQNCRNIEVLNLNGCTKTTDATCTSLSKFCSKLRHLDLASCTSITNMSLKALSEGCPLLEQLNISWCDQVTKDGIQALVRGCGGLKALFLKGCTQLEDEALKYIGAHCPELVTLNLQTCLQITDDGLITICRGCHKLQSLCASGCSNITDAILNALGQNCPRLRILEVARCSQLTDVGFTTLARNCHELEKMDLEECVQITDSTLIQLSIHCPRLQVLSLSHCELITDDGIRHLGNGACAHDQLEVIELDNCPLITDASLEHLKSCHSLERIELYDCQQITRAGIKRLRQRTCCSNLAFSFGTNFLPARNYHLRQVSFLHEGLLQLPPQGGLLLSTHLTRVIQMGIAPLKEPPVLPSCFWAWFSPGQEQVGNKCESPPQEEMGREVSRLHLFSSAIPPKNPGKSLKQCLFLLKWRKKT